MSVERSGDSIGIVAVDYTVAYLPPGVTDPESVDAAMALTITGSVQFQGGQTRRDFSETLANSAFLETGGNFLVTLENATITGGGVVSLR